MHVKNSLFALLAAKASSLALPQVESVEVHDPVADAIAAYEEAADVHVEDIVVPSADHAAPADADTIAAAVADATSGGLERRHFKRRSSFDLSVAGYNGPESLPAAIQAPKGDTTYMGVQTFPGDTTYDPNMCAQACTKKTEQNVKGTKPGVQPRVCRFFTTYVVTKDGGDPLFTCTYYTQPWDRSYATNSGSTRGGVKYENTQVMSYTLQETREECVANVNAAKSYENQGLAYRVYQQPYRDGDTSSSFTANHIFGQQSSHEGITQRLDWINAGWPYGPDGTVTIGGYTFRSDQNSVLAQGFFTAPSSGNFIFSLSPAKDDNFARIWVGDKAYSSFREANADAKVAFVYEKIGSSDLVNTPAFQFTKGQIYPMTFLWSNSGTQAQSFLKITDAAGNDVSLGNFARPCDVSSTFPLPSSA